MAAIPALVGSINVGVAKIVNADASGQKDVFTAGATGSKLVALVATSDDTTARVLQLSVLRSGVNYVIGTVNVPIAAGTDGTVVAVDLFNRTQLPGLPLDNDGQHYLLLMNGDKLQVKCLTTVTAAKIVAIVAQGGDL